MIFIILKFFKIILSLDYNPKSPVSFTLHFIISNSYKRLILVLYGVIHRYMIFSLNLKFFLKLVTTPNEAIPKPSFSNKRGLYNKGEMYYILQSTVH